jgi:hypothetical protein
MQTRERLHQLIDALPEESLPSVERFLAERRDDADPFLRALANAPKEGELLTPEEEAAVREGLDAIDRGDVVTHAEVRREHGL